MKVPEECTIVSYDDLIATLVKRRHDLGLSQGDVDYLSGLQEGYTGKVEAWTHPSSGRTLGRISMPLLLEALGVVLVVMTKDGQALPRRAGQRLGQGVPEPAWPNPAYVLKRTPISKKLALS